MAIRHKTQTEIRCPVHVTERIDSQDLGVIISLNELSAANALLALPRLYFMVLHPAG